MIKHGSRVRLFLKVQVLKVEGSNLLFIDLLNYTRKYALKNLS